MKKRIIRYYKASGSEATEALGAAGGTGVDLSPYSFGTLWKEISGVLKSGIESIANIGTTRLNQSGETARYYWAHSADRADSRDNNLGFYILLGLVLVVGLVVFIVKNKKSK